MFIKTIRRLRAPNALFVSPACILMEIIFAGELCFHVWISLKEIFPVAVVYLTLWQSMSSDIRFNRSYQIVHENNLELKN